MRRPQAGSGVWRRQGWAAAVLVAGCGVIDPQTNQLDTMKRNAQAGRLADNAGQVVTCTGDRGDCAQRHLIKGDSCYALAQPDAPDRRARALCADDELGQGLALLDEETSPAGSRHDLAEKQLDAMRTLIDTRRPGDPSAAPGLARAASQFAARYPGDPAGRFYQASAALTQAQDGFFSTGDKAALCAGLARAAALRGPGVAAGPLQPNDQALAGSIAGMRKAGACP